MENNDILKKTEYSNPQGKIDEKTTSDLTYGKGVNGFDVKKKRKNSQKLCSYTLGKNSNSEREDPITLPKKEQSIIDENQSKGETFIEKLKKEKVDLDYELVMDVFVTGVSLTQQNLTELKELKSRQFRDEYLNKRLQNGVANTRKTSEAESINYHIYMALLFLYRAETDQLEIVNWFRVALFCETISEFTEKYRKT